MTRAPASARRWVQMGAATACSSATTRMPSSALTSVRARQAEHMLGQIGKDQVGRDRRHLVEPGLAELALDIELLGKAETPMGLDAGFGRSPACLRRQHLGHVGFRATVLT